MTANPWPSLPKEAKRNPLNRAIILTAIQMLTDRDNEPAHRARLAALLGIEE